MSSAVLQGTPCHTATPNTRIKAEILCRFGGVNWVNYTPGEESNMSLIKNRNQEQQNIPQDELKRLWGQILSLKEQERSDSEDKFKLTLMFATMEQFQEALTIFMHDTESRLKLMNEQQANQLKTLNESQIKALNLQDVYRREVAEQALKIVRNTYASIEKNQSAMFDKLHTGLNNKMIDMSFAVDRSANDCKNAAKIARDTMFKFWKLERWRDYLQWVAPATVLLNLIFRLIQQFLL
jgi:hypothetical protein